jgi:hypothetical protein
LTCNRLAKNFSPRGADQSLGLLQHADARGFFRIAIRPTLVIF